MFSRVATLALAALPLLAAATPLEVRGEPASSCSTGPIQCCNTATTVSVTSMCLWFHRWAHPLISNIIQASDPAALGIVLQDLNVGVGLTCSPVTVIGVGTGNECSANTVCCENNNVVSNTI